MDAGSIWVTIGAKVDSLVNGVNTSKKEIAGLQGAVKDTNKEMSTWGNDMKTLSIPLLAVGAATYTAVQKFGGLAMELKDLSLTTGISTQKLQDLNYTAMLSGTPVSKLSLALNTMTAALGEAADEASPAYKAFMGLGIDPRGRTPDEVFDDVAVALNNIRDPAAKAAAAQAIFGKNWKEMLPYIETYLTKQEEIHKSAKWTDEELQSMEDAKLGWDRMTGALTIYTGKFLALIQIIQDNMNKLNPIAALMGGNLGETAGDIADAATGGTFSKLQGELDKKKKIEAMTKTFQQHITIINPSGTPADVAAAVQQASRDLARQAGEI